MKNKERIKPVIVGNINKGFDLFALGDHKRRWIPSMEQLQEFADLLKDLKHPNPFIVYHYAIRVEKWGKSVVFILGDPEAGWIPSEENQEDFLSALEKAKAKFPALIYHYGVNRQQVTV